MLFGRLFRIILFLEMWILIQRMIELRQRTVVEVMA